MAPGSNFPSTTSTLSNGEVRRVPLLPTTGIVLPEMVVTIQLESDEAKKAVEAATQAEDLVVLVPKHSSA